LTTCFVKNVDLTTVKCGKECIHTLHFIATIGAYSPRKSKSWRRQYSNTRLKRHVGVLAREPRLMSYRPNATVQYNSPRIIVQWL